MNKIYAIIGCIGLAACHPNITVPASPSTIANKTVLDEQVGIEAETSYSVLALAIDLAVKSGVVHDHATAQKLIAINDKGYALVQIERTAYAAGNAPSYNSAVVQLNSLVVQGLAIINGARK